MPPTSAPSRRAPSPLAAQPSALAARYLAVRQTTAALAAPLEPEDCTVSSMPDVSPTKWHLAHTSWFFETFVLTPHARGYAPLDPRYAFLFNSYYVQAGERHCRAQRGLATRPTLAAVLDYRAHVDEAMERLCEAIAADRLPPELAALVELGLHHEQQHQELLLQDIKHVFFMNPLRPRFGGTVPRPVAETGALQWRAFDEGLRWIGQDAGEAFAYDNERPRHRRFLESFLLASRLVTNGEYAEFIADGGYATAALWLSDGWARVQADGWQAPLYWERAADGWTEFTLAGGAALDPAAPVVHLSFYEAEAFARWAGARLPREDEWEVAAAACPVEGSFLEGRRWHPAPASGAGMQQLYGEVWQWTASPYVGYPGFRAAPGAIGEYNGKFMCDQWVLRGASCATPRSHARLTYRNFYPSAARWMFGGVRLARSA